MWIPLTCPFDIADHSTTSLSCRFAFCLGTVTRGTPGRVPAQAKLSKGHNPDIKSLVSTVLCAPCIWELLVPAQCEILLVWNWESHNWLISPTAKVKLGSLWSDAKMFHVQLYAWCCPWSGREWAHRVILRHLLSLFVCLVFPSQRVMIIKSIFL